MTKSKYFDYKIKNQKSLNILEESFKKGWKIAINHVTVIDANYNDDN